MPRMALLPIHFFTIVLNGEPFIRHHIDVLKELPFPWHWHVIEGVAALNHDTAWSRRNGGTIPLGFHQQGVSVDGTSAYLDGLALNFPRNVSIYRKQGGAFWDGKIEMVRAPLARIREQCLLWQVDADELWTVEQICRVQDLFALHPEKTAAYFYCHYFVGENLVATTRGAYGNQTSYEWLRVWRYRPGLQWISHEPPRLGQQDEKGKWIDLATVNPFLHADTEPLGLVFQHYAYVTDDQLRLKESYYGYREALQHWRKLQAAEKFPTRLSEFFPWVNDATLVDRTGSQRIQPLAQKNILGQWRFRHHESRPTEPRTILFVRPDAIGDTVLAASMIPLIREKHPHAKLVIVCQDPSAELYEASPFVDEIISVNRQMAIDSPDYRNRIASRLQALGADLCLNSVCSREPLTDFLALSSLATTRVAHEGTTELIDAETKERHDRLYSKLIPTSAKPTAELDRHRDFLSGIGIDVQVLRPTIWLTPEDEIFGEDFFQQHRLQPERTIALFAGAQADVRIYPHYGQAIAEIDGREELVVIAVGSKSDHAINQQHLDASSGPSLNVSGTLNLRQTAALLKRCRLAVGGETGLAQIACAVGTPKVIVLGGGHFGRFMPYSPLTSVVCLPLECYGCNWFCRYARPYCVKDIIPKALTEAIRRTWAEGSGKPRVFVQGSSLWQNAAGMPKWKGFERWLDPASAEIIRVG